ncbi:hypothetical protein MXAN_3136 [Myxococcus xanthus DK 1622]|uniref:Uncharacterized protein n=1 Tax=Myxococcus xanthus (strain DK1622) TaxID=246197 RepID=Q1D7N4_MYXXD|nr:hypothetical protein MXAN_3136 [Myxococcus xanthus DK 1622]
MKPVDLTRQRELLLPGKRAVPAHSTLPGQVWTAGWHNCNTRVGAVKVCFRAWM